MKRRLVAAFILGWVLRDLEERLRWRMWAVAAAQGESTRSRLYDAPTVVEEEWDERGLRTWMQSPLTEPSVPVETVTLSGGHPLEVPYEGLGF